LNFIIENLNRNDNYHVRALILSAKICNIHLKKIEKNSEEKEQLIIKSLSYFEKSVKIID